MRIVAITWSIAFIAFAPACLLVAFFFSAIGSLAYGPDYGPLLAGCVLVALVEGVGFAFVRGLWLARRWALLTARAANGIAAATTGLLGVALLSSGSLGALVPLAIGLVLAIEIPLLRGRSEPSPQ